MMAEYAAAYGGPPAPETAWPLFLALLARTPMFRARHELSLFDAVGAAIGVAFGGGDVEKIRRDMIAAAFPVRKPAAPRWIENLAATDGEA